MTDLLLPARRQAYAVRFAGEQVGEAAPDIIREDSSSQRPMRRALDVTSDVTPNLFQVVRGVCENLLVPLKSVRARVYASEEMQARCSLYGNGCLIEISSSLVDHLEPDEQAFVVGHELGHFLLDHHFIELPPDRSAERYRIFRSREISADRLGFIAAGSPEAAMRAIMKTFSGLNERHLRFDAASFLRRSFNIENATEAAASQWDTHPSFAVRARCLIHFAPLVRVSLDNRWLEEFNKVDGRVSRDFEKYSEGALQQRLEDLVQRFREWVWVSAAAATGRIASSSMTVLEADLEPDFVARVRTNFSRMSATEVEQLIDANLENSIMAISQTDPSKARRVVEQFSAEAERKFQLGGGIWSDRLMQLHNKTMR
jgi:hypothetical protein